MTASPSKEQSAEHPAQENLSSPAAGSDTMTGSSKKAVKPAMLENDGRRDSTSSAFQKVAKRVEAGAQELNRSARRTVQAAWDLGDALVAAKALIAHGHWEPWLQEMGLNPRLAQRCMALRRRVTEKRHVSDFKSINAALRMLPAGRAIDAEFEVQEVKSPNDGPKPKEPPAPSAGPNAASDLSTSTDPDGIPTGVPDETSTIIESAGGSNSGMAHAPGIETPCSSTAATPSSRGTDSQADEDVDSDIGSFLKEFDGISTRLDTVLGKEPALVTRRLRPCWRPLSRTLCALAATMASCLEFAGDNETSGDDVPEDLVPTLQRLLKAVSERRRPRSDNSENLT